MNILCIFTDTQNWPFLKVCRFLTLWDQMHQNLVGLELLENLEVIWAFENSILRESEKLSFITASFLSKSSNYHDKYFDK